MPQRTDETGFHPKIRERPRLKILGVACACVGPEPVRGTTQSRPRVCAIARCSFLRPVGHPTADRSIDDLKIRRSIGATYRFTTLPLITDPTATGLYPSHRYGRPCDEPQNQPARYRPPSTSWRVRPESWWISDSPNPRYRPHHVRVTNARCPNGVNAFIGAIDPTFTVFRWTAPYGMVGGVFEPVLDVLPWPYTRKEVGA